MATIHLVRHGEAAAGFGTHRDPGLSELGQKQARSVAALLSTTLVSNGPVTIFSSPLARAYQTAEPLAAQWQQDILIEKRVAEIPSPSEDLNERAQWLHKAMQGTWRELAPEFIQWQQDLVACLLELEEDCVLFSHYVAINAAVGAARNDDRMRIFAPDNCSVTTLTNTAGKLEVVALGRTAQTKIN
ncbi:MAG: histidine phosphatase family protein [bacterium]